MAGFEDISPSELHAGLTSGRELALLDVRSQGAHAYDGHPLLAVSLPLDEFDTRLPDLVPRRSTPLVVLDSGDGDIALRGARQLSQRGYDDVRILGDGVGGWRAAGFETYTGLNVFSKAFGEWVQRTCRTPSIGAAELKRRLSRGDDIVLLDSRPADEFGRMHIEGAINCPAAELPYRFDGLVPSRDTTVIVTCAGRTRGIIGAQALHNIGVPNEILTLENGTMGWLLAGEQLLWDAAPAAASAMPEPAVQAAHARARALAERFGIRSIDGNDLSRFTADAERTLYLFDVRDEGEQAAGRLEGAISAPGTQLVMFLEDFVGTRNARIVLTDGPDAMRAVVTASWLTQMGWAQPYVLPLDGDRLAPPRGGPVVRARAAADRWVSPYAKPEAERREAFEEYVGWSAGLLRQLDRDRTHSFAPPPLLRVSA